MSGLTGAEVDRILALADAFEAGELDLTLGETRIVLRKGPARRRAAGAPPSRPAAAPPSPAPAAEAPPVAAADEAADLPEGTPVPAPLAGTFYRAPRPGAAPFVKPGDRVGPDTVIGIVELMKLMNSVPAGVAGEVVAVLAADGQAVEPGSPLIVVRPE